MCCVAWVDGMDQIQRYCSPTGYKERNFCPPKIENWKKNPKFSGKKCTFSWRVYISLVFGTARKKCTFSRKGCKINKRGMPLLTCGMLFTKFQIMEPWGSIHMAKNPLEKPLENPHETKFWFYDMSKLCTYFWTFSSIGNLRRFLERFFKRFFGHVNWTPESSLNFSPKLLLWSDFQPCTAFHHR